MAQAQTIVGGMRMTQSSPEQLRLGLDPWRPYQERVDGAAISFQHLLVHVPRGGDVVEYWVKRLQAQLSSLSFDLQNDSEEWRHGA